MHRRTHRQTHRHRSRVLLASSLAATLAVSTLAVATTAAAEPSDGSPEAVAALTDQAAASLADLPAQRLAPLAQATDVLAPGETAGSPNLTHVANIPKNGGFAPEGQYSTDLAFQGRYAFAGNYGGFTVYDVANPTAPQQVAQVVCPGSQNDISVYGDLLVLSTDSSRSNDSCENVAQSAAIKDSWEGIKVFDISEPTAPEYVASVETQCGSHTHSLAPSQDGEELFVYVSSYSPNAAFPDCQPPHDLISVVQIPLDDPAAAELVSTPVLFPDGGNPGGNGSSTTSGCHDITTYPSKDLAAGACMGDGILLDISDRAHPVVTEVVRDTTNFAFWHSATFNNAGTKVVFTDELGGGGAPTCNPTVGPEKGADAIYDIVGGELVFKSYYKIEREQAATENCVAHNGSLIPVPGRDIMVQAWYQGGISVWDFTDSANPVEIAWFDRGPLSAERLILGGSWSAYWYNGAIISNDIQQGLDVLLLDDPVTNAAKSVVTDEFNPQAQPTYTEPPAWSKGTAYAGGTTVTYGGAVWRAQWWTKGQVPGADAWGPWEEIAGVDSAGVGAWKPSRVYVKGDSVTYEGTTYTAKWWTRNQAPGDRWGPWDPQG
ncbi:carbohydrate-binding protein [Cellulosimicrobium sp. TH-20]|uniref:carbohydrate-binding protein n=1 Tax=Cellulosimicrobium sp. TH-20 TaxID=1980001 RepID=UPI002714D5D6|nr:carbohydrate-binding protein [Cellulosimicrobium sp. TH-20]